MCGRFTLKTPVANWLSSLFPDWQTQSPTPWLALPDGLRQPRYNIAPTQQIAVVRMGGDGATELSSMRWGLVPSWADSLSVSYINARSETLADKPSFRSLLRNKRCVVLGDGYYEWKKLSTKAKEPYWIHSPDEHVFAMAGLWTENRKIPIEGSEARSIVSATIITTESNRDVSEVHDRMPAILWSSEQIAAWLAPSKADASDDERLLNLLVPSPLDCLRLRVVTPQVNNARNEGAHLLYGLEDGSMHSPDGL